LKQAKKELDGSDMISPGVGGMQYQKFSEGFADERKANANLVYSQIEDIVVSVSSNRLDRKTDQEWFPSN
jgi:hypothetical protein